MKKSIFLIFFFLTIDTSAFARYFYAPSESDINRWEIKKNVIPGKLHWMICFDDNGMLQTIEIKSFEKTFHKSWEYLWPIP